EQLRENAYLMGQMVDADTAYITSRGLRTLGVRLRQHHESSLKVAEWLAEHPQVARVYHPALPVKSRFQNSWPLLPGRAGW
ncbi:PLP-dependent transferase, partial [Escherichia sp. TWPC-MK]